MKSKLKKVFNTNYGKPKIKYLTFNINYFKEQKFHLNPQLNWKLSKTKFETKFLTYKINLIYK